MPNMALVIFAISVLVIIYFFWYMSLNTEIDETGMKIQFKPFLKKYIKWSEIKSAKIVNYGFVGYGIRFGSKHGTIYNTQGNKGLAIELKNGNKFLIGTQKENELRSILKEVSR